VRGLGGKTKRGEWVEMAGGGVEEERETGAEWRKEKWVEGEERAEEGERERGGVEEERGGEEWMERRGGTVGEWVMGVELPWFKVPRVGGRRRLDMVWLVSLIDILLMILLDLRLPSEGGGTGGKLETLAESKGVGAGECVLVSSV
jgi:hypothetical protein